MHLFFFLLGKIVGMPKLGPLILHWWLPKLEHRTAKPLEPNQITRNTLAKDLYVCSNGSTHSGYDRSDRSLSQLETEKGEKHELLALMLDVDWLEWVKHIIVDHTQTHTHSWSTRASEPICIVVAFPLGRTARARLVRSLFFTFALLPSSSSSHSHTHTHQFSYHTAVSECTWTHGHQTHTDRENITFHHRVKYFYAVAWHCMFVARGSGPCNWASLSRSRLSVWGKVEQRRKKVSNIDNIHEWKTHSHTHALARS